VNATDVRRMVNEVIVHQGWPFAVTSVAAAPAGWQVVVRSAGAGTFQFTVAGGQPTRMRVVIQEVLEAQLY
jgi:hypothetical protein